LLLMVMLAFVNGMERLTETAGRPGNVIVLSPGVSDELLSYIPVADAGELALQPGVLRNEQGLPLCSREIYTVISQPGGSAPGEGPGHGLLQIRGVEDAELAARVHRLKLYPGGCWFSQTGVREYPAAVNKETVAGQSPSSQQPVIEAVLGEGVARALGLAVGDLFPVGRRRWLVGGSRGSARSPFWLRSWVEG